MEAEINNIIYMELYSGAKMDDKYLKTNNVRSIDRDSTVFGSDGKKSERYSQCF
jgi:hypothetical protein